MSTLHIELAKLNAIRGKKYVLLMQESGIFR
jgi:hypothetical protein